MGRTLSSIVGFETTKSCQVKGCNPNSNKLRRVRPPPTPGKQLHRVSPERPHRLAWYHLQHDASQALLTDKAYRRGEERRGEERRGEERGAKRDDIGHIWVSTPCSAVPEQRETQRVHHISRHTRHPACSAPVPTASHACMARICHHHSTSA